MGVTTILNAIRTPVVAVLLLIFFVEFCSLRHLAIMLFYGADTDIGKKYIPGHSSFRPGLNIVKFQCPSTYIMPIWTISFTFTLVAWLTVPDTSYPILGENLAKCDKRNKIAYQAELANACETAQNHRDAAKFLMVIILSSLLLHSIMTYFRVRKRTTCAKWPALIICEIAKNMTAVLVLLSVLSFKDTGETTAGSVFFVSMCIVFTCHTAVTLGRIAALYKIKNSPGGLTSANFNAQYFGTDPKCPFATWVFPWEKKMENENQYQTQSRPDNFYDNIEEVADDPIADPNTPISVDTDLGTSSTDSPPPTPYVSKTSHFEWPKDMSLKNVKNSVGTDVEV